MRIRVRLRVGGEISTPPQNGASIFRSHPLTLYIEIWQINYMFLTITVHNSFRDNTYECKFNISWSAYLHKLLIAAYRINLRLVLLRASTVMDETIGNYAV